MLNLRAQMILKFWLWATNQILHFIFEARISGMHKFMIGSLLFTDGAFFYLESLHATVYIRELRRVIELIICVFNIVMRFCGDQLSLQNLALVYHRLVVVFQLAKIQFRDIDRPH